MYEKKFFTKLCKNVRGRKYPQIVCFAQAAAEKPTNLIFMI